ncbi:odorant receptor coreceptor [Trichogramma pretiosum]|uniref:odorant receptor coreceptor n=1 Tax=Trichogramma pretiosum TaxID=7493 RepID=UPI0006C93F56|nr:odorant receptor coreceptor [Trichogramma pretiosum]
MMKMKQQGLVADLLPNIRVMQFSGHFMFNYYNEGLKFPHRVFCIVSFLLILVQYSMMGINLAMEVGDPDDMAANTITMLFFIHPIVKTIYFAARSKTFYKTLGIWNNPNTHPLFAESDAHYHSVAVQKMRKLATFVGAATIFTLFAWTTITFFEDSVKTVVDKETNETTIIPIPRLPIRAWYPFNSMKGFGHIMAFVYQFYYLAMCLTLSISVDVLFCSWLIFACEQIMHLKAIMKPLMELSATLDTVVPNSGDLFKAGSDDHLRDTNGVQPAGDGIVDSDVRGIYSNRQDFTATFRPTAGTNFNGNVGPNGLTKKQEMLVRSAIKYWVERHKHVVKLVTAIGDTYGVALLLHMLATTITLTLLAYQATKINGVNPYGATVIGYLLYTLGQVFHFCIFGNRLIEESSSVMEAAYSCHWYDGSEEAKTFVQIVCQQCQKAMSISGAKFFTVSLDLFASVLGAVVTYFMVLVQLK